MFPSTIKGYKIIKKIGSGGGGEVWLAEKAGKKFAIKIPKIDIQQTISKSEIDNFLKKAELWSKLDHSNIVKVYEFGAEPVPFVVMEYCETNLRSVINKLTHDEIITIAIKIADALNYAHNHGVIHRDLKPENILFRGREPKIGDWGIAKILLNVTTKTSYTGTPLYSAPEQLDPDKFGEVDWRTDVWQFGCVLYELFEKKPPFYSDYLGQLTVKILTGVPSEPKNIPTELREVLMRCLEKRKNNRWSSIGAILEKLKEYMEKKEIKKHVREKALSTEEVNVESTASLLNEGVTLHNLGRYEEAIKYYDKVLSIDANHNNAWYNKGLALSELGRYEEAIKCFDKALAINPNDADAWYNKGVILHGFEKHEEAIKCFNKVLDIDPNNADAWIEKGILLNILERFKDAIECFDRALAIRPNDGFAKANKRFALTMLKIINDWLV